MFLFGENMKQSADSLATSYVLPPPQKKEKKQTQKPP